MKQYKFFLFGALLIVLSFASFSVGTAYATTGCFPDTVGHWAETFICWLKDNGITSGYGDATYKPENGVTRGEMAVFLQKVFNLADASAQSKANTAETNAKAYAELLINEPPSTGEIRINSGPNSWAYYGTQPPGTLSISRTEYSYNLTSSVANTFYSFMMTPDFPSGLYGRKLNVTGMEYCYTANGSAYISNVTFYHYNQNSGAGQPSNTILVQDSSSRANAACLYYSITPKAVDDNTILSVSVEIAWGSFGAGYQVRLGRVTFYFQPTTAALPAPQADDAVPSLAPDETRPNP